MSVGMPVPSGGSLDSSQQQIQGHALAVSGLTIDIASQENGLFQEALYILVLYL